jgi:hypothetical protein
MGHTQQPQSDDGYNTGHYLSVMAPHQQSFFPYGQPRQPPQPFHRVDLPHLPFNPMPNTQRAYRNIGSRPPPPLPPSSSLPQKPLYPLYIPSVAVLYCEPCDKEFPTSAAMEAHNRSHESCRHPGCSFRASKKVVVAHYHSAHGQFSGSGYKLIDVEGQKFKVLLGTNEAEVNQWREDRKRKFPTAETISKKKEDADKLAARGGAIEDGRGSLSKLKKQKKLDATTSGVQMIPGAATQITMEADDTATVDTTQSAQPTGSKIAADGASQRNCMYFGRGLCKSGENCKFNHNFTPAVCPYFSKGRCTKGSRCLHIHDRSLRTK